MLGGIAFDPHANERPLILQVQSGALTEAVFRSGPDCELQGAHSFTGGRFWATSDQTARNVCATDATATADTAVDIVGDGVWLVQNGRIRVSEDRGRTW